MIWFLIISKIRRSPYGACGIRDDRSLETLDFASAIQATCWNGRLSGIFNFCIRFLYTTRKDSFGVSFLKFTVVFHQFPNIMIDGF